MITCKQLKDTGRLPEWREVSIADDGIVPLRSKSISFQAPEWRRRARYFALANLWSRSAVLSLCNLSPSIVSRLRGSPSATGQNERLDSRWGAIDASCHLDLHQGPSHHLAMLSGSLSI